MDGQTHLEKPPWLKNQLEGLTTFDIGLNRGSVQSTCPLRDHIR